MRPHRRTSDEPQARPGVPQLQIQPGKYPKSRTRAVEIRNGIPVSAWYRYQGTGVDQDPETAKWTARARNCACEEAISNANCPVCADL
jgi:hypothetical protein